VVYTLKRCLYFERERFGLADEWQICFWVQEVTGFVFGVVNGWLIGVLGYLYNRRMQFLI
jgi:hypothetical protein